MKVELGLTSFADNTVIHMPEGSNYLSQTRKELEISLKRFSLLIN